MMWNYPPVSMNNLNFLGDKLALIDVALAVTATIYLGIGIVAYRIVRPRGPKPPHKVGDQ